MKLCNYKDRHVSSSSFAHLTMFSCIYMVIDCDYVVVMVSDSEDDQWIVSVNIVSVSKKT